MKLPLGKFFEYVVGRLKEHTLIALESVGLLEETVQKFEEASLEELNKLFENITQAEKKGDEVKRAFMSSLNTGHLHPEYREDFLRVTLVLDEIPGLARAIAKKMLIFKHVGISVPQEVKDVLVEIARLSKNCIESLLHIVENFPQEPSKVIEYSNQAERLEEKVDELRLHALESLFKYCKENFGVHCVALHVVIDDAETITDKCEDIADIYRLILVSR